MNDAEKLLHNLAESVKLPIDISSISVKYSSRPLSHVEKVQAERIVKKLRVMLDGPMIKLFDRWVDANKKSNAFVWAMEAIHPFVSSSSNISRSDRGWSTSDHSSSFLSKHGRNQERRSSVLSFTSTQKNSLFAPSNKTEERPPKRRCVDLKTIEARDELVFRAWNGAYLYIDPAESQLMKAISMEGTFLTFSFLDHRLEIAKTNESFRLRLPSGFFLLYKVGEGITTTQDERQATIFVLENPESNSLIASVLTIEDSVIIRVKSGKRLILSVNEEGLVLVKESSEITTRETFTITKAGLPVFEKQKYIFRSEADASYKGRDLEPLSASEQEELVLKDILCVLNSKEGNSDFFQEKRSEKGLPEIVLSPQTGYTLQAGVRAPLTRLIQVITMARQMRFFIATHSRFHFGRVSQAFCEEAEILMKDLSLLVIQLESRLNAKNLTMQSLILYLEPARNVLNALTSVCSAIHNCESIGNEHIGFMGNTGGGLLNIIFNKIKQSGEHSTQELYIRLMKAASVPYFEMLGRWIFDGIIDDPFNEFMIEEQNDITKESISERTTSDAYWNNRYVIQKEHVPRFLFDIKNEILSAGKYLNVMLQSSKKVHFPGKCTFEFDLNTREMYSKIREAYHFASKELLDLLMQEERLLERLVSMKRYFFISQGDFFVIFLDSAEELLQGNAQQIQENSIRRLLDLSVATSTCVNDPFREDLTCDLSEMNLLDMVKLLNDPSHNRNKQSSRMSLIGFDSFELDYKVEWPLSLIFTRGCITKYQLIFRLLFYLKHISRLLCRTWQKHQMLRTLNINQGPSQSHLLRMKMMDFLKSILYYLMDEVIEPNWLEFFKDMKKTKTVDEVINMHSKFLDKVLKLCLLRDINSLQTLVKICHLCKAFSKFNERCSSRWEQYRTKIKTHNIKINTDMRETINSTIADSVSKDLLSSQYQDFITEKNNEFDGLLQEFFVNLRKANFASRFLHQRLNYNDYYTNNEAKFMTHPTPTHTRASLLSFAGETKM